MALRWDFKEDLIGWYEDTETKENGNIIRLYDGNALMIAVWWQNDTSKEYWLYSFFCDEEHAKNCLESGLLPKEAVFHLYRGEKSCKKLARLFARFEVSVIWEDVK